MILGTRKLTGTIIPQISQFLQVILVLIAILAGLGIWCHFSSYAQAEQSPGKKEEIVALGVSRITDDNVALARQKALSSAIVNGVQRYLVSTLGEKLAAEHLDRLVESILPNAKELVENYYVIKEMEIGDRYSLLLKIKINDKLVDERLHEQGLLTTETKPVRVLFLVGSQLGGSFEYWWANPSEMPPLSLIELVLFRAFQNKGFDLINRTVSVPSKELSTDMKSADLDSVRIKRWGEVFGADVVVYGKSEVNEANEMSISLQVVGVGDGVEHCRFSRSGGVVRADEPQELIAGLEHIVKEMMPNLEPCIIEAGGGKTVTYKKFEVTLKDLQTYGQYKRLRDFMSKDIPGVKEFRQSRIGSHYVSFVVEFQGDEERFANLVMYHDSLPVPIRAVEKREGEVVFFLGGKDNTGSEE